MRRKSLSSVFQSFYNPAEPMKTDKSQISTYYTSMDVKQNVFCPIYDFTKNLKKCAKKRFPSDLSTFFQKKAKKRQKKAVFLAPLRLHLGASTKNQRKKHVFSSFLTKKFFASCIFTFFSQKQQKNAFFRLFFVDAPRRYIGGGETAVSPPP